MSRLTKQQKKNIQEAIERDARTKIKVLWQDAEDTGGDLFAGRTWRVHLDMESFRSYEDGETQISVLKDGAIILFSDSADSHVYLYPDQVKYLAKAVTIAKKAIKK